MKILYCPWRKKYVTDVAHAKREDVPEEECVFCRQFHETKDEDHFILRRFKHHVVMLNLYPYNSGHLLIVPLKHYNCLEDMPKEAREELIELANISIKILQDVLDAKGINVGINIGKASGAGIPAHIHTHVLPRWIGDTNFLPVLAETKQISTDLKQIYKDLKPAFDAVAIA